MTLDEIELQLACYRWLTSRVAGRAAGRRDYAIQQRLEGLREKLCKDREPARSELIWLRSIGAWPWSEDDDDDCPEPLRATFNRWKEIIDNDAADEPKQRGVTRAEFTALEKRITQLEAIMRQTG